MAVLTFGSQTHTLVLPIQKLQLAAHQLSSRNRYILIGHRFTIQNWVGLPGWANAVIDLI